MTNPNPQHRQELILWGTLLASIVIYALVLKRIVPESGPAFVEVFLPIAAVLVVASFAVRAYFRRKERESGDRRFRWKGLIISLTCCEAAALFGVAVWSTSGSSRAYWFLVLGFAAMVFHYPASE